MFLWFSEPNSNGFKPSTANYVIDGQGQPNVEALHDQPTKADLVVSSGGVVGVGGRHPDAATIHDDEHVDAQEKINMFENTPFHPYTSLSHPSLPSCSHCEYEECKDSQDKLFEKVEVISKAVEEFKSKRSVIPSKKHVDKILSLMRKRQLTYPKAYDAADRIVDLYFCKKLKGKYDQINTNASACGAGLDFLVFILDLDEKELIKYVRRERPNPHDKSWTEVKRIITVISINNIHYRAIDILLEERKIKVYDCNEPAIDEVNLFFHVQPLMDLLHILLRESKLLNHLLVEVLMKKSWDFEVRNKGMNLPKYDIYFACGLYALAYIEYLLTGTEMAEPMTFLYDNDVVNL
ncbi:hypothetical protein FXO38_18371 [Capsicum annuum]|nr:hypothetical protein FXO38_18371 [Capsicum annuum]